MQEENSLTISCHCVGLIDTYPKRVFEGGRSSNNCVLNEQLFFNIKLNFTWLVPRIFNQLFELLFSEISIFHLKIWYAQKAERSYFGPKLFISRVAWPSW